ncbi:MAG: hypothetical protein JRJ15_02690 [Deltaproteobacteria bacterium]|nr:hypothetical protein [Deltaproteobacteria bacterium]
MENSGLVEIFDKCDQDLPYQACINYSSATTTDIEEFSAEPEDISERNNLRKVRTHDVAVLVPCTPGGGESNIAYSREGKKYFWVPTISTTLADTTRKPPIIVEVAEDYLGFPGEAVGSVSPWPALWQHFDNQPMDSRGVFYAKYPRKALFSKTMTFKTAELPRWKPKTIIGLRTFEEEDV